MRWLVFLLLSSFVVMGCGSPGPTGMDMGGSDSGMDSGVDTGEPDNDMDGVPASQDCDDDDDTLGAMANDADCDGVLTADDCDDADASSTTVTTDADCDGSLTANDCDDDDASVGDMSNDADCDGAPTASDCDDANEALGDIANDADCDGTLTADDCDDNDANSATTATDADCDGVLPPDDCDDNDASVGDIATDADCDGSLTSNDCNDADDTIGDMANDADCDGTLTADDCDDNDANSATTATDADCDGVLPPDDCDDNDPLLGAIDDDADCDGALSGDDCDDDDASLGDSANDADCDGVLTADDCDDTSEESTTVAADADCDGSLTADDCDDGDATVGAVATDADCDRAVTAVDCNDADVSFGDVANDADCDGALATDDCDDLNASLGARALDADCDGVLTAADNCDDRYNPGQEDVCDVWFVDADAPDGGDGTSWATAFNDPPDALDASSTGDQIWFAEGTYRARTANAEPYIDASGRSLYGGFAGSEMTLATRAGLFHETILTGDVNGDDDGTVASKSDNANRILRADGTTLVDGFVIADANQQSTVFGGAGIFAGSGANLTVRNCVLRDNRESRTGGGIGFRGAAGGLVENSVFLRNFANQGGGGIAGDVSGSLLIRNVAFMDSTMGNSASGAAIGTSSSGSVTIDNVSVSGSGTQPGIRHGGGALTLTHAVIFGYDTAFTDATGNAVVRHTAADQDLSAFDASNIFLDGGAANTGDPFVRSGTRLLLDPASICVDAGDDALANVAFPAWTTMTTRLDEALDATPVDLGAHYAPEGTACLGDDNSGDSDADGVCDDSDACFGDNASGDSDSDGVCDDSDACTGDDATADADGDGVCDDVDNCVPVFNPGQEDVLSPFGEGDACAVVFVDASATGTGDGSSWANAVTDLDAAVTAAQQDLPAGPLRAIWVAQGVYVANADNTPVLTMVDGLEVYGGFVGDEVRVDARPSPLASTVLSGDRAQDDTPLDRDTVNAQRTSPNQPTRVDNSPRVVIAASDVLLDGLEIRDAYAVTALSGLGVAVGGETGVVLRDVVLADNVGAVVNAHGAIGVGTNGEARLERVVVQHNIGWNGAGVRLDDGALTVVSSTFVDNGAMAQVADLYNRGSEVMVEDTRFLDGLGPQTSYLAFDGGTGAFLNVLFAGHRGNGVDAPISGVHVLTNVTIVRNSGRGLLLGNDDIVRNGVLYGNTAGDFGPLPGMVTYTCAERDLSSFSGGMNVLLDRSSLTFGDPYVMGPNGELFMANLEAGNGYTSACVDTGDPTLPDTYFPRWSATTTRVDGVLDGANADDIDPGFHY